MFASGARSWANEADDCPTLSCGSAKSAKVGHEQKGSRGNSSCGYGWPGWRPGLKENSVGATLAGIIDLVGRLLTLTLFINALLSWAPLDPMHPVRRTLRDICDPIIAPFRRLLPPVGMMDFSPFVAMIAIQLIATLLASLVLQLFP